MSSDAAAAADKPPAFGVEVLLLPVFPGAPVAKNREVLSLSVVTQAPPLPLPSTLAGGPPAANPTPPPPHPPAQAQSQSQARRPRRPQPPVDDNDDSEEEEMGEPDEEELEEEEREDQFRFPRQTLREVFLADDHQDVLWALVERHVGDGDEVLLAVLADQFVALLREFADTHPLMTSAAAAYAGGFAWEVLEIADLCFLSDLLRKKNPDTTSAGASL